MPFVKTQWMTILCDDDLLDEKFVETVNHELKSLSAGVLVVGFDTIDGRGNLIERKTTSRREYNDDRAIMALALGKLPSTAGIGGFIFCSELLRNCSNRRDYPGGYYSDTRLGLEALLTGGIRVIPDVLYRRRCWSGAESSLSAEKVIMKFEAQLLFVNDVLPLFKHKKRKIAQAMRRHLFSFKNFFNANILPAILQPEFTFNSSRQMLKLSWKLNKRFLPHCILLIAAVLINCRVIRESSRFFWRLLRRK